MRSPSPCGEAYLPVADAVCRKVPLILVSLPPRPAEEARSGCEQGNEDTGKAEDSKQGKEEGEEEKQEAEEET